MGTVTVPAEFFREELRVYADWREAFARELLQNALDARARRISVQFSTDASHGRVVFDDDGVGMTRQVLEEVFFALGRTTKHEAESIGGFGRARIIICFAQARYRIRTGHLLVEGTGGEYQISEVDEHHQGCEFAIDLQDKDCDAMERAFRRLLATCSITVPIRVDGQLVETAPLPARASRVLRDAEGSPWGRVYVQPGGVGKLVLRVHGLAMAYRWIPGNEDIFVEIVPARSREVLSASRDQLHSAFREQVDQFVADLSSNRRRALRPPQEPLDLRVGGGGFLRTDATREHDDTVQAAGDPSSGQVAAVPGTGIFVGVTPANGAAAKHMAEAAYRPADLHAAASANPEAVDTHLGFDVFLMADTRSARVRRLARAFDPSYWNERTGRRRRALLLAWKEAVAVALESLVELHPELVQVLWTVGWTFDSESRAAHRNLGDGHVLVLNPVTPSGALAYQLSRRGDRRRLLAAAVHEVAHVAIETHDEDYAALLTGLFGQLDPIEADRRVRSASHVTR